MGRWGGIDGAGRLTYGITPPKLSFSEDRRQATAAAQAARLARLPVDALVVYDLQDESSRTDAPRPFPYLRAIDPLDYAYGYLGGVELPKIVYRSVSGMDGEALAAWLRRLDGFGGAVVLVGAPSRAQAVTLKLSEAYRGMRPTNRVPDGEPRSRYDCSRWSSESMAPRMGLAASRF